MFAGGHLDMCQKDVRSRSKQALGTVVDGGKDI